MKALILAAGYATRLYPLTRNRPKPLLKLGKKPIVDRIIGKIDCLPEVDEVSVITNSRFISDFKKWRKESKFKLRLSLIDDLTKNIDDRRGAIGDLSFAIARKRIKDDLLIIAGDNIFADSLRDFVCFGKKMNNVVIGAYNIKSKAQARQYGVIKLDRNRRLVNFEEKPEKPKSTLVAMCLYYFPKKMLGLVKEYMYKDNRYDTAGSYISWLERRTPVYGYIFNKWWYDIGDHKSYREAQRRFINKQ
ncbi:MAG: nucleotidyltransferase family protein [Candidatus Omnitrophica bacterium]|nr:nucleotidyltransferase family protein [Candidatus Omnitrophota bacterium]